MKNVDIWSIEEMCVFPRDVTLFHRHCASASAQHSTGWVTHVAAFADVLLASVSSRTPQANFITHGTGTPSTVSSFAHPLLRK